jgi:hypothetical protein
MVSCAYAIWVPASKVAEAASPKNKLLARLRASLSTVAFDMLFLRAGCSTQDKSMHLDKHD